ncbi:MAG: PTS sugar transporter subunit IIA [Clostridiales bacterium]|nr:PTS sugar transporter subunit IIA [Clostridiales bacterium]
MLQPLLEGYLVEETFLQSVLDRESILPTNLRYIALPHGNPIYVNASKLVVGRLSQPVLWNDEYVCCVFLFAASAELLEDRMQLYDIFYRAFSDPDVEERIKRLQQRNLSDEAFKQLLFHILR